MKNKTHSKIRRIAPPKELSPRWDVRYRPCVTGISIDISLAQHTAGEDKLSFMLTRASYLIPWETIDNWSKAPRGKLVSIKQHENKTKKEKR